MATITSTYVIAEMKYFINVLNIGTKLDKRGFRLEKK